MFYVRGATTCSGQYSGSFTNSEVFASFSLFPSPYNLFFLVCVNMHPYLAVTALVLAHPRIIGASPLDLTSSSYAVKESYDVPSQWTMIDEPAQHQTINLHIGLRQSRYNELENILLEGTFLPRDHECSG